MINVNLINDRLAYSQTMESVLSTRPVVVAKPGRSKLSDWLFAWAVLVWVVAISYLVVPVMPEVWYKAFPSATTAIARALGTQAEITKSEFGEEIYVPPRVLPEVDLSLPKENRLVISKIRLNGEINEGEEYEVALEKGVWRTPQMGNPMEEGKPVVLAAHRYGYLHWSNLYRRENSFYNLPKVENGDQIELIWEQRKFVYEVFEGYTDTKIRPTDADLILYTCELLNSDRRIVRLARLVSDSENKVLSAL